MDNHLFTLYTSAAHYGSDKATLVNDYVYTSCAAACKHARSGFPCCLAKDTRIRLLQLKIMASMVAAIYINLITSYRERKKMHFSCITSVNGNAVILQ